MEKLNKTGLHRIKILIGICFVAASAFILSGIPAKAASDYTTFDMYNSEKTIEKYGDYYFKYKNGKLYYSPQENGKYQSLYSDRIVTNGEDTYFLFYHSSRSGGSYELYHCTLSSKTFNKLKVLPNTNNSTYHISSNYGKNIYITRDSYPQFKFWTYMYNTTNGKYTKAKDNCDILAKNGKYFIARSEMSTDVTPYTLTIYKATSSGLKKVKKLTGKTGMTPKVISGKWYYTSYNKKPYRQKMRIYRCNADGSGIKQLGGLIDAQKYDKTESSTIHVIEYYKTYCKVGILGKTFKQYKYTYSTKKMKRISS